MKAITVLSALFVLAACASPQAPAIDPIVARITAPDGAWDFVTYDAARARMYFTRGYGVMTLDMAHNALNTHFADGALVHAVVVLPGGRELLTTNSGDNTARFINATTGATIASVATGQKPDAALYDAPSRLVWVMNGNSGDVTLIDPSTRAVVGTLAVGGKLEFAASDGIGHIFVNAEDRNDIAVIDTRRRAVVSRLALPDCEGPTGLALTRAHVLIASCDNHIAKLIDAGSGADLGSIAIGEHPDAVVYDAARGRAYIPCGDSAELIVIDDASTRHPRRAGSIATHEGAKTGALDPRTGRLYLPGADLVPTADAERPVAAPGTFVILAVDPRRVP
jgi:YVTN family beta-propeller protein